MSQPGRAVPCRGSVKMSPVPARGTARLFARGPARAKRHRVEIKCELTKIGPRFPPPGKGAGADAAGAGADFFPPVQFRCFFCLVFFLFVVGVFALLAPKDEPTYTWKRRRVGKAAPARARLGSGLQKVTFGGGKAEPKPATGKNQPGYGTHGKNSRTSGRQRAGLPGRARAEAAGLPSRRAVPPK